MAKLDGKVAVITGASSGIGEVTAETLAAQGATVVVAARREERLSDLVGRIRGQRGPDVRGLLRRHRRGPGARPDPAHRGGVRAGGHTRQQRGRHAALQGREGSLGPVAPEVRGESVVYIGIDFSPSASSWRRTEARRSNSRCRPSVGLGRFSEKWGT